MNSIKPAVLAVVLLAGSILQARQDPEKKMSIADFEGELGEWAAMKMGEGGAGPDSDSKLAITHEAAAVKSGKGALSYTYDITPKTVRVLALQKPMDLTGMKSLHFWVKCTQATAVVIGLAETGGASYQAVAHCPAGAWQEVALNLSELAPDDPTKDANGKLDLDQIGSFTIFDIGNFLALFLSDMKGTRTLTIDDVSFSSAPVALTTGATQVTKVVPIHLVDNFESPVIRWIPIAVDFSEGPKFTLFEGAVAVDKDVPEGGGKQSLKFSHPRKGKKIHGILRNLEKVDLKKAVSIDLSVKASHDGTYFVAIEEKGGARYTMKIDLLLGDWKTYSWKLSDFTLAEDSRDDNGKLDPDQIKQITIADVTALMGGNEADQVSLWVDNVVFTLSP
jgi:hypothetical protein